MASTPQQTANGAACLVCLPDKQAAALFLTNGGTLTATQIQSVAKTYFSLPDKWDALIYLLNNGTYTPAQIAVGAATFKDVPFWPGADFLLNSTNLTSAQIASGSTCFSYLMDKIDCWIAILNKSNLTANQITAGAASFTSMANKKAAVLYLLANVTSAPAASQYMKIVTDAAKSDYQFSITSNTGFLAVSGPKFPTTIYASDLFISISGQNSYLYIWSCASAIDSTYSGQITDGALNQAAGPINLTAIDVTKLTTLNGIMLDGNSLTALDLSQCSVLALVGFPNNHVATLSLPQSPNLFVISMDNNNVTNLTAINLPALQILSARNNGCSSINLTGSYGNLNGVFLENNAFNQATVDQILVNLSLLGPSNGTLAIEGNAAPSATGLAAIAVLETNGWTVTHS